MNGVERAGARVRARKGMRMRVSYNYHCLAVLVLLSFIIQPGEEHPMYATIPTTAYASEIDDLVHNALVSIREADAVGADTSHLVDRLDDALNLIRQAEHGNVSDACSTRDECLAIAAEKLNSIASDAVALHEQKSMENAERFYTNMLVYAPIGALASSIASVILYTNLKGYMQARMMEMDVREVKEE